MGTKFKLNPSFPIDSSFWNKLQFFILPPIQAYRLASTILANSYMTKIGMLGHLYIGESGYFFSTFPVQKKKKHIFAAIDLGLLGT